MAIYTVHGVSALYAQKINDPAHALINGASNCIRACITLSHKHTYPSRALGASLVAMTPDFVRLCMSPPDHETFLYTGETRCDKVLGILSVSRDGRIVLCHVDPKSFRKGIGTALWRTYLKACTPTLTHVDAPLPSVNWFLGKGFALDVTAISLHENLLTLPLRWKKTP